MNIAIIDRKANEKTVYSLENAGLYVIPTTEIESLYDAVSSHADMQIHYLGENRFICAPEAFSHYQKLIPKEFTLMKGSESLSLKYPKDILYNVAALKDFVICNSRYTAIEILLAYKDTKRNILNVRQGYSKCSTAIVTGNSIITADVGIYKTAVSNEINALKITEGHIKLTGMNYGFIGGATGLIDKHTLAINGDVNTHPDAELIKSFCKQHNVELLPLNDGMLEDIGSIITNLTF